MFEGTYVNLILQLSIINKLKIIMKMDICCTTYIFIDTNEINSVFIESNETDRLITSKITDIL